MAAAQIRMANVVQVLDYGIDGALPYLVMELLEGEDLGARLAREGRLSLQALTQIFTPTARALQRAHDAGLVHRDLKPENIFLASEGDEVIPKILDFGVAKAICGERRRFGDSSSGEREAGSTSEGTVVGSPYYMSPEQALGRTDIDHRSDLWALGVIAFRALTGRRPFNSDVLLEAVLEICSAPIPRATSIAPDLPPEVDRFFERALAREPSERFQSVKELVAALVELEAGRLSGAPGRPPGRPLVLGIGVAMIVAALAIVAAVSWTSGSEAPATAPLPATAGVAPATAPPGLTAVATSTSVPGTAPGNAPPEPRATATGSIAASARPPQGALSAVRPIAPTKAPAPDATATATEKEVPGEKPPSYDLGY
jgi:serine/threonine-protein kinase